MNYVEPIRNPGQLQEIEDWLAQYNYKYYIMFEVGKNTGLRVSDVLSLRVEDVYHKSHIKVKEKKTGKWRECKIPPKLGRVLDAYCKGRKPLEYLVPSNAKYPREKPISTIRAYQVMRRAGEACNLKGLGTHSMRKTFGYFYYKQYHDVAELMRIFNHSSPSVTLRYIGIEQEGIDKRVDGLKFE